MKKPTARDAIVKTAARLFYKQGYSNTGINQIIEEAGVAKSTLYQRFRSKEDLLMTYLDTTGSANISALTNAASTATNPKDKLLAIFDYLQERTTQPEFHGCHFLNLVYEMPEGEERARIEIKKQKDNVRTLFAQILKPIHQEQLADEIYILFEGALIGHKTHHDTWPIQSAKNTISKLL
ncbi:TetR/AcrR family transcriptional regulator [Puia sp. P3]|uniref:TetR/AcrR family transcriptional regulator n=1 Tax=Puia sp. P3 TaxID=3423952 RepID=UPI003D66C418